jgi:hypothetical protein
VSTIVTTVTGPRAARLRASLTASVSDEPLALLLRLIAVAGLAIDVWVHATLESTYAGLGGTLTQGRLFGAEAVVAGVVGLWLLLTGHRLAWVAAFLVAASALGAVMLYRYVDVGSLGPLPNMYEPTWYFRKTLSAYAEGAVVVAALMRGVLWLRPVSAADRRREHQL